MLDVLHWKKAGAKLGGRKDLAAFDFPNGSLVLTEAGTKHRASLFVLGSENELRSLDPGGIDVFASDLNSFREALTAENRTLKRALTDPRIVSGIGNAYSDEILHAARLSPITLTRKLAPEEWERLFAATREHASTLDRPAGRRGESRISEKGNCVPQGDGGSWTLWRTVSEVRRKDSAHSLCRQRDQLLREVPDWRKGSSGPKPVATVAIGWPRTLDELEALKRR